MSRSLSLLSTMLVTLAATAAVAGAQSTPPDHYLCYAGGATKTRRTQEAISGERVDAADRLGGPQRFKLRRLSSLCNAAGIGGSPIGHPNVHLAELLMKPEKGAPKFVATTRIVTDGFGSHTLVLAGPTSLLDVTPAQPGHTAPPDFSDDPTTSATEINRFTCYAVEPPKGAPKFVPPTPPTVTDEQYVTGQSFVVKKPTKLCFPAAVDGATPGAPLRDTLLVCYALKLAKGGKFARLTVGTHTRTVGARIVGRRKPAALCLTGH